MKKITGYMHGINLGGWLSQCADYSENHYNSFISEEDIKLISEWGLDHVRLPIDYNVIEDEDGNPIESGYSHIDDCICWCKKYGLNLILDLHNTKGFSFNKNPEDNTMFNDPFLQDRLILLWKNISSRYCKFDFIAFEVLNEIAKENADSWNMLATKAIKEIRQHAPLNKIIVGGILWNSVHSVSLLDIPLDENIVYTFHFYEPFLFTHQRASWHPNIGNLIMNYPGTMENYRKISREIQCFGSGLYNTDTMGPEFMEILIKEAVDAAVLSDVPLYCGEYGVIEAADIDGTLNWFRDVESVLNKYEIGRAAWTYKSIDFGLTDAHYSKNLDNIIKCL